VALIVHSGVAATDLAQAGTKREDISDLLLASLYFENNMLGLTVVGEEFADPTGLKWDEDALNGYKVTDTTGGGQTTVSVTMNLSAADASILVEGTLLQRDTQFGSGEVVQVTAITTAGVVTIVRNYPNGGAGTSDGGSPQVWRVINRPTTVNSDLGKDMTRARISKTNFINRWDWNVNVDSEAIERSLAGYTVGVVDELQYQFQQRLLEIKRIMQMSYWASPQGIARGDYDSTGGVLLWLNGTLNASASTGTGPVFNSTAEVLSDTVVNTMAKNAFRNGALTNLICGGINTIERFSLLYSDRIRIEQSERVRGFFARYFLTTTGVEHRLVYDNYLNDTTGSAQLLLLDMSRIRIRPFIRQFFVKIKAPSFRDGDAVRGISKWGVEIRNTGSDVGGAHSYHTNLSF
jgi:hypothetical protein